MARRKQKEIEKNEKATSISRYPLTIERKYSRDLGRTISDLHKIVKEELLPELPNLIEMFKLENARFDDASDDLFRVMDGLKVKMQDRYPENLLESLAERRGLEASEYNLNTLRMQTNQVHGIDVLISDRAIASKMKTFVKQNVNLIETVHKSYFKDIQTMVTNGVSNGDSATSIAKKISDRTGVSKNRAKLIGRDQTGKLNSDLNASRQAELGVKKFVWSTVGDERVRDEHASLDGKVFSYSNPPSEGLPGQPINCFIGETSCYPIGQIKKLFKRKYFGEGFRICLEGGNIIPGVTPNHPIFTSRGFVPVKLINNSDKLLVRKRILKIPYIGENNINNMKAFFQKINNFLPIIGFLQRVTGMGVDFHGDGILDEDVNIINVNSVLTRTLISIIFQKFYYIIFVFTNSCFRALKSFCHFFHYIKRNLFAFSSKVSRSVLVGSLFNRHLRPLYDFCFRTASNLNLFVFKYSPNNISGDLKTLRKDIDRFTFKIPFSNFIFGESCYFIMRYGHVFSFKKVKTVEKKSINAYVYNLETTTGVYLAQDVLASNCRCVALPIFEKL